MPSAPPTAMTGRVVVLTSASAGIGAAAALQLAALGATVGPVGRSAERRGYTYGFTAGLSGTWTEACPPPTARYGQSVLKRLPVRSSPWSLSGLSHLSASRDLRSLYNKHFREPRKERQLLSNLGFFAGFGTVRAITHAIKAGKGPFGNISPGGKHIHHMTFGIAGLLLVGYLWMLEVGMHKRQRKGSRFTSVLYGVGSALTLDEFALWLNLEDVYWAKEGRESIDAVVLFGSLLSLSLLGKDLLRELVATSRAAPRTKALIRARRFVLHHPYGLARILISR